MELSVYEGAALICSAFCTHIMPRGLERALEKTLWKQSSSAFFADSRVVSQLQPESIDENGSYIEKETTNRP